MILEKVQRDAESFIKQRSHDSLSKTIYAALDANHITTEKMPEMRRNLFRQLNRNRKLHAKFNNRDKTEWPEMAPLAEQDDVIKGARENEARQRAILGDDYE